MSKKERICIVGAGAAGLSAARYLADRGYPDVTVFEADTRVGGKCCSVSHRGRTYDLGAVLISPGCAHVLELARRYGVAARKGPRHLLMDLEQGTRERLGSFLKRLVTGRERRATQQLLAHLVKHRRLARPGFEALGPDLHLPIAEYFQRYGLTAVGRQYYPLLTGYGYGYAEQVPVAYLFKLLYITVPPDAVTVARWLAWTSGSTSSAMIRGGYQSLWERVAGDGLRVHTEAPVERVRREAEGIDVTVNGETQRYDRLVVTTDPRAALTFLDATPNEVRLLSQVQFVPYRTVLCEVDGLPPYSAMLFADHCALQTRGRVVILAKGERRDPASMAYLLTNGSDDDARVEEAIADDTARAGGRYQRAVEHRPWRYFPYVAPSRMRQFYRGMQQVQGQRRTYWAGEIMNFPTVETVCQYSRHLVDRYF